MRDWMRVGVAVLALAMAAGACGGDDYTRIEEAPGGETPASVPDRDQTEAEGGEQEQADSDLPGAPVTEPFDPDLDTDRDGILGPDEGLGDADGDGVRDRDEPFRP